jgi:hypothetical protein
LYTALYVWTEQYQNALFALDAEKLFAEITKAEAAIQRRKSELLQESTSGSDELAAIETPSPFPTFRLWIRRAHPFPAGSHRCSPQTARGCHQQTGRFLDPIIVVVAAKEGFWTPNGRDRLGAMHRLGAEINQINHGTRRG